VLRRLLLISNAHSDILSGVRFYIIMRISFMRKLGIALLSLTLAAFSGAAFAGDAAAGEEKATLCLDCHFSDDFPNLSAEAIETMIRAARAGEVKHSEEINELAEEDIADVAAYFAHEGSK
jgi:cytochrome c553